MHGFDLAALLFASFWVGAFMALLVRAMIEDAAQRRLGRETVYALTRDRGATMIRFTKPALPPRDPSNHTA